MGFLEVEPGVWLRWEEAGAGRPLVLVHGWATCAGAFAPQLEDLASAARVIAYDLRGHGRSTAPPGPVTVSDHARDLIALMAGLGLRGAVVAGWSMGGQVALEAAPALGDRLAALALLSTTPRFCRGEGWPHGLPPSHVRALATGMARDPHRALERFFDGLFAPGELASAPTLAALRARALGEPPCSSSVARAGLAALLESDQRPRLVQLRALGVPVVFIHGGRDPISAPGASEDAARAVPGARRLLLPGCGHAPHLSRPAEVNGWLRALLAHAEGPA